MIPLIINNEIRLVPKITELNTEQFAELIKLDSFNLIDYLAIVLGLSHKVVEGVTVRNPLFLAQQLYPVIPDYSKHKPKKQITIDGKVYLLKKDFTLGQRFLIEENGKGLTGIDLYILILAVTADQENYPDLLPKIKQMPAAETLPDAFFLAKNLRVGKNYVLIFLNRFLLWILIPKQKNRQGSKR